MPEYRHGLAIFARRYCRELYARLKTPLTVVFDNYQGARTRDGGRGASTLGRAKRDGQLPDHF